MIDMSDQDQRPSAGHPAHGPLPIDAFGALPQQVSKLPGLGGPLSAHDPAYVFKTLPIRPALGRVVFTIAMVGIRATRGTLVIRVTSTLMVDDALPVPVKTVPIMMVDVAAQLGIVEIEIDSQRNVFYALTGHIYDETDATAEGIAILLDRTELMETARVRPSDDEVASLLKAPARNIKARPEMVSVAPPLLAWPASQPMTSAQFKEKPFAECMARLSRRAVPSPQNWIDAYILQVLRHFVPSAPGKRALSIGAISTDIHTHLADQGWDVTHAAAPNTPPSEDGAFSCPIGADAPQMAAQSTGPINLLSLQAQFAELDLLVSVAVATSAYGRQVFPKFLAESVICLKPGGVALHIIDYSARLDPVRGPTGSAPPYARSEIERMALATISHGQEVAQLKFALERADAPAPGDSIPFGIIARRQW